MYLISHLGAKLFYVQFKLKLTLFPSEPLVRRFVWFLIHPLLLAATEKWSRPISVSETNG